MQKVDGTAIKFLALKNGSWKSFKDFGGAQNLFNVHLYLGVIRRTKHINKIKSLPVGRLDKGAAAMD